MDDLLTTVLQAYQRKLVDVRLLWIHEPSCGMQILHGPLLPYGVVGDDFAIHKVVQ